MNLLDEYDRLAKEAESEYDAYQGASCGEVTGFSASEHWDRMRALAEKRSTVRVAIQAALDIVHPR